MKKETDEEKIQRVAHEIQEVLVREKMALIPTLSLQIMPPQSPILTPSDMRDIITP